MICIKFMFIYYVGREHGGASPEVAGSMGEQAIRWREHGGASPKVVGNKPREGVVRPEAVTGASPEEGEQAQGSMGEDQQA